MLLDGAHRSIRVVQTGFIREGPPDDFHDAWKRRTVRSPDHRALRDQAREDGGVDKVTIHLDDEARRLGQQVEIGAMSDKRLQWMPDVPTFAEQGIKGFVLGNWVGLMTVAGTPAPTIKRIADEVSRVLKMPDVSERLIGLGFDPGGGTPAELATLIATESVTFAKAVKASGATTE